MYKYKKVEGVVDDKLRNDLECTKQTYLTINIKFTGGSFRNVWFFVNFNLESP